MKTKLVSALMLARLLTVGAVSASAQDAAQVAGIQKQRLWVQNYKNLNVVIVLEEGALKFGFTPDEIRTKVELRLRQAQIRPLNSSSPSDVSRDQQSLWVDVSVVNAAFHISIEFHRKVVWALPDDHIVNQVRSTWDYGITGTHANDRGYIMSNIDTLMDDFLNEYLKANQ